MPANARKLLHGGSTGHGPLSMAGCACATTTGGRKAAGVDPELKDANRKRLRRMVRLRLDPRLQGRVDASDVLQDAYLEASQRLAEYLRDPKMPFFLWLRFLTGQRIDETDGIEFVDQFTFRMPFGSAEGTYTVEAQLLQSGVQPIVTATFEYGWAQ